MSHTAEIVTATFAGGTTILLPCGHLYGFLLGAAATGSALTGAIFMFAFWLSTVPALVIGPVLAKPLMKFKTAPRIAGLILAITGLISLASFASNIRNASLIKTTEQTPAHSCH